jgi:bifunctional non-homologous end joining protein LigD
MGLEKYYKKRDFKKTPEPRGRISQDSDFLFVIQKHDASHLHYDFRLELDGVLKSWAVPKGPCFDPKVKRLAMHVEDHPIEYGTFEGIIPQGEYGGGTVVLWDQGVWIPLDDDPLRAYDKGHLRFELDAKKLKGRWDLFQFKGKTTKDNTWFLVKYDDNFSQPLATYDITVAEPNSVVTGASIEEIAQGYQAVWTRKEGLEKVTKKKKTKAENFKKIHLELEKSKFPSTLSPQLATLTNAPPGGDDWAHEIKFDGYRMLAFKHKKTVTFLSRSKKDWTKQFAALATELKKLPLDFAVLDGEVVFLDKDNRSDFQSLQNALEEEVSAELIYFVFDILYYDQWDVHSLNLLERKTLLEPLLKDVSPLIRYSDHIIGQGQVMFEQACKMGLEGIISKQIYAPYSQKRTTSWLKVKCTQRQEFLIGGFTPPQGARNHFGSLYLGLYNDQGTLDYCGNVGTGFTQKSLDALNEQFAKRVIQKNPFNRNPPGVRSAIWVKPELIAEIEFAEWTSEGHLRHPSFKGLREDKSPAAITQEKQVKVVEVEKNANLATKDVLKLTNPDKILYEEDKITKRDIWNYYDAISDQILPYIRKRPLTLVRCPKQYQTCFFQKHFNKSSSEEICALPIESSTHELEEYMYLINKNGLLGLVQMGVLEIHPWGSTIEDLENPDIIIFDLDPAPELSWGHVVEAARHVRDYLQELQLTSFVKTTGGKGLHVVVPVKPEHNWEIIKNFSQLFAEFVQNQHPDKYVTNMAKKKRTGKIFLDYLRNQRNATAVAPYSTRARIHAPVAVPVHWDELTKDYKDTYYTIKTLPARLKKLAKDPWQQFFTIKQKIIMSNE